MENTEQPLKLKELEVIALLSQMLREVSERKKPIAETKSLTTKNNTL